MIYKWMRKTRRIIGIMDKDLEYQLKNSQADKIFNLDVERNLDMYQTFINGFYLTFMKSHCLFGARCYYLNDNFANVLGFSNIQRLKQVLPIRKSRKYISVDSIRRAINRYAERSMDLEPIPEYIKSRRERDNKRKNK